MQLGQSFYTVEIGTTNDELFISAFNIDLAQTLLMKLDRKAALDILSTFDNDFDLIAKSLKIDEDGQRLLLLSPSTPQGLTPQNANFIRKTIRELVSHRMQRPDPVSIKLRHDFVRPTTKLASDKTHPSKKSF